MDDQPNGSLQPVEDGQTPRRRTIPKEPSHIGRNITAAIWALILVAVVILVFQNWTKVKIEIFFWSFRVQLTWILLVSVAIGILIGRLVPYAIRRRRATKVTDV